MSQWENRLSSCLRQLRRGVAAVALVLCGASSGLAHDPYCWSFGSGWRHGYPGCGWGGYSAPCFGGPVIYGGGYGTFTYGSTWSGYGWGLGGYGGTSFYSTSYPVYPPIVYPAPISPVRLPTQDGWPGQDVWDVLHQQEQGILANDPALPWADAAPRPNLDALRFLPPSSPEAIIASQGSQDQGDRNFQQFRMARATEEYRDAIAAAPERPEPYFRLAVTLAARRDFLEAVNVLERLMVIDPDWPAHGTQLSEMFVEGDQLPKMEIKQRVADWVLEDVRDADRLFLLGVLLFFDGDPENARTLMETAALIEGDAEHLTPFLNQFAAGPIIPAGGFAPEDPVVDAPVALPEEEPDFGPRFGP